MNYSAIDSLQPTTLQLKKKFYPTDENTECNSFSIDEESVELMKKKPIFQRLVSCYDRNAVDGADVSGALIKLGDLLNARSPQVEALRAENSYIEKKRMEDNLPIFTPCCVLRPDGDCKNYYPIIYTCLIDFDILKDDNPNIDFEEFKHELTTLQQVAYCGMATNGIDLFCIVPISTPQRYEEHAAALIRQFKKQGIAIRVADGITHTRTISSDPNGYFNENAKEFTMLGSF